MLVRELITVLKQLNSPDSVIDMASDEEGNSFGDVSEALSEGFLKDGRKVFSLYPENMELPEERYGDDPALVEKELKDYYSGKSAEETS